MLYGLPYMGSKTRIAEWIGDSLPSSKRFVDLFGGGGAMSHWASMHYDNVLYNEINPSQIKFMRDAISGKFLNKPVWVSREEFFERREFEGEMRIWGFGSNLKSYLYAKDGISFAHARFDFIVNNIYDNKLTPPKDLLHGNWNERRQIYCKYCRQRNLLYESRINELERWNRCSKLAGLNIDIQCGDYRDYKYQDGDVVYCDPPYEGTAGYGVDATNSFNHKEFYEWVATRKYPVYFSCYKISDNRFKVLDSKINMSSMSSYSVKYETEYLYGNKHAQKFGQQTIFSF